MKKSFLIIPALAALTLAACGGGNSNSVSEANNAPSDTLAEYIAYQVYTLINPDSAAALPNYKESKLNYDTSFVIDEESYVYAHVNCIPNKNGGYTAVYKVSECWEAGDWGECTTKLFKIYRYADGKLTEDNTLIPKPTFDDFNKYEALWFYSPDDKNLDSARAAFAKKGYHCNIVGDSSIVAVFGDGDSFLFLPYKFNGEKFVQVESDYQYGIIATDGLRNLRVGDIPPSQLASFDINTMGRTMYFNRNAKKEFKIALSDDGKIDTIIVVGKSYNYRYWCGGGYCYLMVGSDINSEITDNLNGFVYEDGHSCIKTDGSVVEFCCKPDNNTIESIKIYKENLSNTESDNESDTQSLFATGDLNGDGIKDSVAFNNDFFVYFGNSDGKYNLFKKYKVVKEYENNDYNYIEFNASTKIENGKLKIDTRRQGDGWEYYDYTLKFQDNDFVLLQLEINLGLDGYDDITYDFEAKTYQVDSYPCDEDPSTTVTKLKNLPLPKLSDIVIGGNYFVCYKWVDKYIDESTSKTTTK